MAIEKFDYIESQADANELIAEFGQIGAIRRQERTGGVPWDPESGTLTDVDYPCTLAVLPIDMKDAGRDIGGTVIKSSDLQILGSVIGLSITPTTTDTVLVDGTFNGAVYEGGRALTIVRCNTLAPAGVPVMHDMLASA